MKEIALDMTIAELLNNYKGMKDILIEINPKFKKLNNPILRRTLAKLATVKQVAIIGGMDSMELLNRLRESVGQKPLDIVDDKIDIDGIVPGWAKKEPSVIIDTDKLLEDEKNPLTEAYKILKKLNKDEVLEIISSFRPEPLIADFISKSYRVNKQEISNDRFSTKIIV